MSKRCRWPSGSWHCPAERYGEADPRYAAALNGLATFLQLTGSLDRAEELLRRSLAIDLAALGPDHPDVATRQANLALVLLDKDNPAEAAELCAKRSPAATGSRRRGRADRRCRTSRQRSSG